LFNIYSFDCSLVGIFISNQFEFKFNDTSNLNIEDGQIKIRFNRKEHGMSKSPKVSIFCFRNYDKLYEPAYGGAKVDIEGNVIISIPSNCFEQGGKIVIQ
jgi:hypothetical protein